MPNGLPERAFSTPNPDPTIATTEQLLRETSNSRELIESKISGAVTMIQGRIDALVSESHSYRDSASLNTNSSLKDVKEILETRLIGMDKAIGLLQEIQNRIPVQMDEKLLQLRALHQEKFDSIKVQFAERDTRTEQTAAGVKIAVDAALQAAKEAVAEQNRSFALATGKSETATMKQIDALGLAIQTANKGLDDKIADMKDRLTRIEGMDLGSNKYRDQQLGERATAQGSNQNFITFVIAAVAILGLIVSLIGFFTHSTTESRAPPYTPQRMQLQYTQVDYDQI